MGIERYYDNQHSSVHPAHSRITNNVPRSGVNALSDQDRFITVNSSTFSRTEVREMCGGNYKGLDLNPKKLRFIINTEAGSMVAFMTAKKTRISETRKRFKKSGLSIMKAALRRGIVLHMEDLNPDRPLADPDKLIGKRGGKTTFKKVLQHRGAVRAYNYLLTKHNA